jgi:putative transposase
LARENGWGYTRILGEINKLGVRSVARSTVKNILKENGLDPGPKRGEGTWDAFVRRHAATLWATDFFSQKVWTARGMVDLFILFVIHVGTRRIHIAGITTNPDAKWVDQQGRNLAMYFADQPVRPTHLIRDLDSKFAGEFDAILAGEGIKVVRVGPRKPNLNAYAERWVQSCRAECLDHFVIFGEAHLRHIVSTYVSVYNDRRPHQSRNNRPPSGADPPESLSICTLAEVACEEQLSGLLRHYYRKAA